MPVAGGWRKFRAAASVSRRREIKIPPTMQRIVRTPPRRIILRIVVITKQQNMVDGRADFPRGGIHKSEAHVAAGIFDAVKVARDVAVRRKNQHAAGVSE